MKLKSLPEKTEKAVKSRLKAVGKIFSGVLETTGEEKLAA